MISVNKFLKFSYISLAYLFCSMNYLNAYEIAKKGCLQEKPELYNSNGRYIYPYKYQFKMEGKKASLGRDGRPSPYGFDPIMYGEDNEFYCDFLFSYVDLYNNVEKLDLTTLGCTNNLKLKFEGEKESDQFLTNKLKVIWTDGKQYSASAINTSSLLSPKIECFKNIERSSNEMEYKLDSYNAQFKLKYTIDKTINFE